MSITLSLSYYPSKRANKVQVKINSKPEPIRVSKVRQKSIRELTNKSFFDSFFQGVNVSLSGRIPIGRIPKNNVREIVMKVYP